jgi:branched-chain amino acid transport system ATP-binding protein
MSTQPILVLDRLSRSFGGVAAVAELSFSVAKGELTALIGPNGAGKTTTLNLISGFLSPQSGTISIAEQNLVRRPAHGRCALGVSRTFQTPQVFAGLSALDNVLVGANSLCRTSSAAIAFRTRQARSEEAALQATGEKWLEFVGFRDRRNALVQSLPFGSIRLVEIARALASSPELMLMDEPASGLSPAEAERFRELLFRIRDTGITILWVEHNMTLVMSTAHRVLVMERGHLLAAGSPSEICADKSVQEAYLGTPK